MGLGLPPLKGLLLHRSINKYEHCTYKDVKLLHIPIGTLPLFFCVHAFLARAVVRIKCCDIASQDALGLSESSFSFVSPDRFSFCT